MTRTYSIFTKHLEMEITIQTKDVITHSIMSGDEQLGRELRKCLDQGIDFTKGLVRAFEKDNESELDKVGK